MHVAAIANTLKDLNLLHENLLELATEKTDVLIRGDMDFLKSIMSKEQKLIKLIQNKDQDLRIFSKGYLQRENDITLNDVIKQSEEKDSETLIQLKQQLEETIKDLKNKNETNQQLLQQSLQFVQVSLDLLKPSIETYNYERPMKKNSYETEGYSSFESKV
ncbi:flagellar protein FlgN [Niallia sp. 01092]|uniref:flagellar protein FlgN n=1 Tax=unclassified Niallia TaxID=2837522 RepID=UPI003FD56FE9